MNKKALQYSVCANDGRSHFGTEERGIEERKEYYSEDALAGAGRVKNLLRRAKEGHTFGGGYDELLQGKS